MSPSESFTSTLSLPLPDFISLAGLESIRDKLPNAESWTAIAAVVSTIVAVLLFVAQRKSMGIADRLAQIEDARNQTTFEIFDLAKSGEGPGQLCVHALVANCGLRDSATAKIEIARDPDFKKPLEQDEFVPLVNRNGTAIRDGPVVVPSGGLQWYSVRLKKPPEADDSLFIRAVPIVGMRGRARTTLGKIPLTSSDAVAEFERLNE